MQCFLVRSADILSPVVGAIRNKAYGLMVRQTRAVVFVELNDVIEHHDVN